jgi:hypothetical protein
MIKSESILKISPALLKAQKEIGVAKKEASNPFFHSRYADLGSVMEVCKKPCNDNGITILQPVESDENGNYIETILLHDSGEFISSRMKLAVKSDNNPQDLGSAISYAKRYSLQAMLLIPSEDDDGEKATNHNPQPKQEIKPTVPKTETNTVPDSRLCGVCNTKMDFKSGDKDGKHWAGYFCPNSTKENRHPPVWTKQ